MNPAIALILIYIVITAVLQFAAFFVSKLVDVFSSGFSLPVFLILFLTMFWVAWPLAVRVAEAYVPGVRSSSRPGARI